MTPIAVLKPDWPRGRRACVYAECFRVGAIVSLGIILGGPLLPLILLSMVMVPVTREFGWSHAQYSLAGTLVLCSSAVVSPFVGHMVDRLGVRPVVITGAALTGLTTVAISRVQSLTSFYTCLALVGAFAATTVGFNKVVGAVFSGHRGKAFAFFGLQGGVAAVIAPQLVPSLNHFGWRDLFFGIGLLILGIVPLLYCVLDDPGPTPGQPIGKMVRTPAFWLLLAAFGLSSLSSAGVITFLAPMLSNLGYEASAQAAVVSVLIVASIAGAVASGCLLDWIPRAWIGAPVCVLSALALLMLEQHTRQDIGSLLGIGAMLGFSMGARQPLFEFFQARLFGMHSFAAVSGLQTGLITIALGAGFGWISHSPLIAGSHDAAFGLMEIALCSAGILCFCVRPGVYLCSVSGMRVSRLSMLR